jgi:hypothetical protein
MPVEWGSLERVEARTCNISWREASSPRGFFRMAINAGMRRSPDLSLDCVFGAAVECVDTQVLLDPLKEEFTCQRH